MKFVFQNDTVFNKIKVIVSDTWMCLERGEGEEEIANHGRSRVKSFSQETEAKGQQTPMIGEHEPKLHSKEFSAGCTEFSDSTPLFSLPFEVIGACEIVGKPLLLQSELTSDSPRAFRFTVAS